MTIISKILISPYSPEWAATFQKLKDIYESAFSNSILSVEHVGSTSVEGLAAKPIIDIDIVIENKTMLPQIIIALKKLGYYHRGDLGIEDREAFLRKSDRTPLDGAGTSWMKHNLYVCPKDSISLKNHLLLRDHLRKHPDKAKQYGELKMKLAAEFPFDIDKYIEGKTVFIAEMLKEQGFDQEALEKIREQNKAI